MNFYDKQICLLRFTSMERGEKVFVSNSQNPTGYNAEYLGKSPESDKHLVMLPDKTLSCATIDNIFKAPLAWLEDKPVYVGDRVHYYLEDGELACGTVANVVSEDLYVMQEGPCLAASRVFWEPKHKYLSADGVELEVGQKVYHMCQGLPRSYHIKKLYTNDMAQLNDHRVYSLDVLFSTPHAKIGEEVLPLDGNFYFSGNPCAYKVSSITESQVILRSENGDGSIGMSWEQFHARASTFPYISINGFKVPLPETEEPAVGTAFWVPHIINLNTYPYEVRWNGDRWDKSMMTRGLVHLSKEAAEIHAKALLSFTERIN